MNGRLGGRLARLEQLVPVDAPLEALTYDELTVRLLDLSRKGAADDNRLSAECAASAEIVANVEAGIRWQAALANHPAYAASLERLGEMIADFVPAISGHVGDEKGWVEVESLEKPQAMERRAALRSRSDIQALIEVGAKEVALVMFNGQFVAASIRGLTAEYLKTRLMPPGRMTEGRRVQ